MGKTIYLTVKLVVEYDTDIDDVRYDLEEVCTNGLPDYVRTVDIMMPEEQIPD